jgi:metal-sulfur cluster biosynthetic enzyme
MRAETGTAFPDRTLPDPTLRIQTFPELGEGRSDGRFDRLSERPLAELGDRALAAQVWASLSTVFDPELDEPITDLGFVPECSVVGGAVRVRLRLPTAFCSPSFAYLMASDAYDAVTAVPGVDQLVLTLDDHSDSETINAGLAQGLGFAQTFPAESSSELHELRLIFQRKAHQAYVERVCSAVVASGWLVEDLHRLTMADVPAGRLLDGLERRRIDLGLPITGHSPVCVDEDGMPWPVDELPRRLRFAKAVRVSIDGNAHFCRGLLRTRYPDAVADQREREHELIPFTSVRSPS